ncbi:hypothetical protein ACA910_000691 [Epithemia clementina (nom. ined.)]
MPTNDPPVNIDTSGASGNTRPTREVEVTQRNQDGIDKGAAYRPESLRSAGPPARGTSRRSERFFSTSSSQPSQGRQQQNRGSPSTMSQSYVDVGNASGRSGRNSGSSQHRAEMSDRATLVNRWVLRPPFKQRFSDILRRRCDLKMSREVDYRKVLVNRTVRRTRP